MLNDPPPEGRKQHPLERKPAPRPTASPTQTPTGEPVQQATLHIPTVEPHVTYALLMINIVLFAARALSYDIDRQFSNWGANDAYAVFYQSEYYRLFTSMFLHSSVFVRAGSYALENSLHLFFNAYMLYVVGRSIEPLFGHIRFGLIYVLGGLTGSILSAVFGYDPNPLLASVSVGASGAVFAILAAEFVYLYQHRKLLGPRARAQMRSLVWLAVINLGFGALSGLGAGQVRVDNWAHLGGMLGGLGLTWFIGPLYIPQRRPEQPGHLQAVDINPLQKKAWVVSLYSSALIAVLIVFTVLFRR